MKYFIGIHYDPEKETLREAKERLQNVCSQYWAEPIDIKKEKYKKPDGSIYYLLTANAK